MVDGGARLLTAADALQIGALHQAGHSLAAYAHAVIGQFSVDARRSIRAFGASVDRADAVRQLRIRTSPRRRWSLQPRIVAAGGDAQHSAHGGYWIPGPVHLDELEDPGGIEPVSRANQAAAFPEGASGRCARISRSSRSCLISRRSRASSWRSALVFPSWRRPSSRSACLTHCWIDLCSARARRRARRCFSSSRVGTIRIAVTQLSAMHRLSGSRWHSAMDNDPKPSTVHQIGATPVQRARGRGIPEQGARAHCARR